jgi:hypothetical protein
MLRMSERSLPVFPVLWRLPDVRIVRLRPLALLKLGNVAVLQLRLHRVLRRVQLPRGLLQLRGRYLDHLLRAGLQPTARAGSDAGRQTHAGQQLMASAPLESVLPPPALTRAPGLLAWMVGWATTGLAFGLIEGPSAVYLIGALLALLAGLGGATST